MEVWGMKWTSAVSDQQTLEAAVDECVSSILGDLDGDTPDLAVAFASGHFAAQYEDVPAMIRDKLGPRVLFGCSAGGVIGGGREIERRPGFSLTAAHLPDVELLPFRVEGKDLPDMDASPDAWEEALKVSAENDPRFLLLIDPFSFPAQNFVVGLDYAFSKSVKIGGMASGGQRQGDNALFLGDKVYRSGAIGIALQGNIAVDTVVAQGCRPVGQLMSVTKNEQNLLLEMDERTPLEVLREIFSSASQRDRELMQHSLFLGIVMDDFIEKPGQGDFLIRNIIGLDGRTGTMAIGEMLQEGQRVQFHLRDALTSAEDLATLLSKYATEREVDLCQGAMLFSCLGRGEYLYGRPDHDTDLFRSKIGALPLGGFFCNGEIGQVGGTTFLHGYTSSFGIFRPLQES
jgi:small ligand-binding sensory domain FIST